MSDKGKFSDLPTQPSYKWWAVALLFVPGFLNLADRVVLFSVVPLLRKDLHISDTDVGTAMSLFLWTYALCSPFAGHLGDRMSRRRLLIACLFAWSLVIVLTGLVQSVGQLFAMRVLLGICEAAYLPTSLAILADYHPRETRGRAYSILSACVNTSPILVGALAGHLGENFGWRPLLFILGGLGIAYCPVLLLFLREVRAGESEQDGKAYQPIPITGLLPRLAALAKIPSFVVLSCCAGLLQFSSWMFITWFPLYVYENFGLNLTSSGFLGNFLVSAPTMLGILLGGILSDRIGEIHTSSRMLLFAILICAASPWPLFFQWATAASVIFMATACFRLIQALGESNWYPLNCELVKPELRSFGTSLVNTLNCIVGGLAAFLGGYFKVTLGMKTIFAAISMVTCLTGGLLFFAYIFLLRKDVRNRPVNTVLTVTNVE